ncbi:sulfurtransferase complex subunit TusB [Marinobacter daepoensis]|uniref:sulfurtransferase complex subunit TusB n=1 Tax=Marinobacter daepoensis TaxID=262077 RepID=UPI000428B600|nr:sulfurtransferase complex subunit TusB [Marinobacter daepoensis]MBY6032409.1 sulfurtransferase complex subunit TusB [Marinobacter daepoensis]
MTDTTLHITNKAPDHPRFRYCLSAFKEGDALILMEDAVLALTDQEQALPSTSYALSADAQARAVANRAPRQQLIDYNDFVQLTATYSRIINW